jgi:hypothetical protein
MQCLRDVTKSSPLKVNRRFGGTCELHDKGRGISQAETSVKSGGKESNYSYENFEFYIEFLKFKFFGVVITPISSVKNMKQQFLAIK